MTYIIGQVRWQLQWVSYIVPKQHELWLTNRLTAFYTPSVNSAFQFVARLRRRRPANGTQQNFARRWTVNCANNLPYKIGIVPLKNWGPRKLLRLFGLHSANSYASSVLGVVILSVRLSVRPSVCLSVCHTRAL